MSGEVVMLCVSVVLDLQVLLGNFCLCGVGR